MSETNALMITRHVQVKLTDGRRLALGCELAEQVYEERKHAEYLENIKKAMQSKIKEAQHRRNIAAESLHQGFEMKEVSCEQRPDLDRNKLVTVRMDTGEQIEERALTVDEIKHYSTKKHVVKP